MPFNDLRERDLARELSESNERLRCAFHDAPVVLWEIDIPARTGFLWKMDCDDEAERIRFEDMPGGVIENGWVHPESRVRFEAFCAELFAGRPAARLVCIARHFASPTYSWTTLSYHTVFDETGTPLKAIGISRVVEHAPDTLERFTVEQQFLRMAQNTVVATMHINLTADRIVSYHLRGIEVDDRASSSYAAFHRWARTHVFGKADLADFDNRLSPEALLSTFQRGRPWFGVEFHQTQSAGRIRWVRCTVSLLIDPTTGELNAFLYLRNIDMVKYWEQALPSRAERDETTQMFDADTIRSFGNLVLDAKDPYYCALAIVELRGLEQDAETLGPEIVDRLLLLSARIFHNRCGSTELLGRESTYRFCILVPQAESRVAAVEEISRAISGVRRIQQQITTLKRMEFSVGSATAQHGEMSFETLRARAWSACRQGDERTRGFMVVCTSEGASDTPRATLSATDADASARALYDAEDGGMRTQTPLDAAGADTQHHDFQTGLLNRRSYYTLLKGFNADTYFATGALFADINGLAKLNRDYGYDYGDALIEFCASSLQQTFHDAEVYRIAGDEFVVIQNGIAQDDFLTLCDTVKSRWEATYPGTISSGYTWNDHIENIQTLVDHAHELMLAFRRRRLDASSTGYAQLKSKLMSYINEDRLKVYLQPKAMTASRTINDCEALVRLDDMKAGLLAPNSFIPQLERNNLIKYLDYCMLSKTLRLLKELDGNGIPLPNISVNFSRKTVLDPHTLEMLRWLHKRFPVLAGHIVIEITERVGNIEHAMIIKACREFRETGFKLALDDFGSEYSSLYMLTAVQFDEVKIDKSLVEDVATNEVSQILIADVAKLCRKIGANCVAEGVENEAQCRMLEKLGCPQIQGYLINKPLPADEFVQRYLDTDAASEKQAL